MIRQSLNLLLLVSLSSLSLISLSCGSGEMELPPTRVPVEVSGAPPMTIDANQTYFAILKVEDQFTTGVAGGVRTHPVYEVVIELFAREAPRTVNNFVSLARKGFYDGLIFYRVKRHVMAQTGDPTGTGTGGPGYVFDNELSPDLRHDGEGVVSMDNDGIINGRGTNGSRFFITLGLKGLPERDGFNPDGSPKDCAESGTFCHTVFGKVISGMPAMRRINVKAVSSVELQTGEKQIVLKSISIEEGPLEEIVALATATPVIKPTPVPRFTPTAASILGATPVSEESAAAGFEGSGPDLTPGFELKPGLVLIKAQHQGTGEFRVRVINEFQLEGMKKSGALHFGAGSRKGRVASVGATEGGEFLPHVGAYEGTRLHNVSKGNINGLTPGSYVIQVAADGEWRVEIEQPDWDDGQAPPFRWSGTGDSVEGPIKLDAGTIPVKVTHNGSSNFLVELLKVDGIQTLIIVNQLGEYQGTAGFQIHPIIGAQPGVYGVAIKADGDWTVELGE